MNRRSNSVYAEFNSVLAVLLVFAAHGSIGILVRGEQFMVARSASEHAVHHDP